MIPPELRKDLTDAIRKQMTGLDSALSEKMAATQSDIAAQGRVHSDAMMQYLAEDATNSLQARAMFIHTQFLRRAAKHLNAETLSDIAYLLRETVEAQSRSIQTRLFSFPVFTAQDLAAATRQYRFQFERETQGLIARMTAELRITAAEAQYKIQSPYTTAVAGLGGPIGLVPTPESGPSIIPHISSGTRQQIYTALQLYLDEINKPENSHLGRGELHELIRDTKLELDKPQPNALKVNANLRTIAETTKFVGSLSPAYQTLLTFLAFTYRS